MMNLSKTEILKGLLDSRIVPVFNNPDPEVCKNVLRISWEAGIGVFEFTNRSENALKVFKELKEYSEESLDILLGVGTIFSIKEAEEYLENGAQFIVSPILNKKLGRFCMENEIVWIPGCGSMTEIYEAAEAGAKIIKIFPANSYGPKFISAAKSIFPNIHFMPTGGVQNTYEDLLRWFRAGSSCIGLGSQLYENELVTEKEYELLLKNIKAARANIDRIGVISG